MERLLLSHLLTLQCSLLHIPFYLYDGDKRLEAFEPHGTSCDLVIPWLKNLTKYNNAPNFYTTEELLILGRVIDHSSGLQIIIGPTSVGHLLDSSYTNIMRSVKKHIDPNHIHEVKQYLGACEIYSYDKFLPVISLLHGYINNEIISTADLINKDINTSVIESADKMMVNSTIKHTYEENTRRNYSGLESMIWYYVSHGMINKLKQMKIKYKEIGNLAPTSLRHHKNACIILNTLCQRAAIKGGLDPEISYQLGEIYIQKIEACSDINALLKLTAEQQIPLDYCKRVSNIINPHIKHPKINKAMYYVRENHQKRLTVEEIAKRVDLSPEYLSTKFRQEAGISLPDYINQQKIIEAKELLNFTSMALSEIAEYLSFSSQSYFQTVFKKLSGDTPMEYRLKNKMYD